MAKRPSRILNPETKKPVPQKTPTEKLITCAYCGQNKNERAFYVSHAESNKIGRVGICKDCIKERVIKNGLYDLDELKEILKNPLVDKPFLKKTWLAAMDSGKKEKISEYFRQINSPGKEHLKWVNSDKDERITEKEAEEYNIKTNAGFSKPDASIETIDIDMNDIPQEIIRFWGYGYTPSQYVTLNDLWKSIAPSRKLTNGTYIAFLKDAIKALMLKGEAMATGDSASVQKYNVIAINNLKEVPEIQTESEEDFFGGLKVREIEQSEKFIPEFPDLILDDADMIILHFTNYIRELLHLPTITLGEVKDYTTYNYERGQEIIFPTADKKDLSDAVVYDSLNKYRENDPEQFNRVLEMLKHNVRPKN